MATVDDSPTRCQGQSWTSWARRVGLGVACEDSEEDDQESALKREGDSMKLRREDMSLFGFCPARDDFYLVVCEVCRQVVKPQALQNHIQLRHSDKALLNSGGGHQTVDVEFTVPQSVSNCQVNASSNPHSSLSAIKVITSDNVSKGSFVSSLAPLTPFSVSDNLAITNSSLLSASTLTSRDMVLSDDTNDTLAPTSPGGGMRNKSQSHSSPVVRVERIPPGVLTKTASATVNKHSPPSSPGLLAPTDLTVNVTSPVALPGCNLVTMAFTSVCSSLPCMSTSSSTTKPSSGNESVRLKPSGRTKSKEPRERKLLPCKDRVFDPDKHCGVFVQEFGKQCTRSLTCKTHSVAMRRNVAGRKKHFDELLADHRATKEALVRVNKGLAVGNSTATDGQSQTGAHSNADKCKKIDDVGTADVTSSRSISVNSKKSNGGSSRLNHTTNYINNAGSVCDDNWQRLVSTGVRPVEVVTAKCKAAIFKRTVSNTTATSRSCSMVTDYDSSLTSVTNTGLLSTRSGQEDAEIGEDCGHVVRHPRPAAVCTFNARQMGMGFHVYNRRLDNIRAVLRTTLVERVTPSSPIKKLCVESRLPPVPEPSDPSDPYCFTAGDQQQQTCVPRTPAHPPSCSSTNSISNAAKHPRVFKNSGSRPTICRLKEKSVSEKSELSNHSTDQLLRVASDSSPAAKRKRITENKNGRTATSNNHRRTPTILSHQRHPTRTTVSVSVTATTTVTTTTAATTSGTTGILPMTFSVSLNPQLSTTTMTHLSATNNCSIAPVVVTTTSVGNPVVRNHLTSKTATANTTTTTTGKDVMMAHLVNGQFITEASSFISRTRLSGTTLTNLTSSHSGLSLAASFARTGLNRVYSVGHLSPSVTTANTNESHRRSTKVTMNKTQTINSTPSESSATVVFSNSNKPKWALVNNSSVNDRTAESNTSQQLRCEVQNLTTNKNQTTFAAVSLESSNHSMVAARSKVLATSNSTRSTTRPNSPHQGPLSQIVNGLHVSPPPATTASVPAYHKAVSNHGVQPNSNAAFAAVTVSPGIGSVYAVSPSPDLPSPNSGCLNPIRNKPIKQQMVSSRGGVLTKKSEYYHHDHLSSSSMPSIAQLNCSKGSLKSSHVDVNTDGSSPPLSSPQQQHFTSTSTTSRRVSTTLQLTSSHI